MFDATGNPKFVEKKNKDLRPKAKNRIFFFPPQQRGTQRITQRTSPAAGLAYQ